MIEVHVSLSPLSITLIILKNKKNYYNELLHVKNQGERLKSPHKNFLFTVNIDYKSLNYTLM